MEVSGQLHAPVALHLGLRIIGTNWLGGWVDPRAVLDAVAKRKLLPPAKNRIPVARAVAKSL
jgi:hypothetical protein